MPSHDRPLSPHLQVYQLYRKIAPLLSITHRVTGMLLFVLGTLFVIYWLGAAAYGPESFATAQAVFGSPLGMLVLFGWTVVLMYHLANGIRHLVWDTGREVSNEGVRRTAYAMLASVVGLTVLAWAIGLAVAL
ncbi:succinate dehydrogenase, cytochrome b556 subunit [Roseospira goensis]|uniref:Succinate dehydrogenase cytochrome b556 subunit n=1 Tax=Roseospira goensis TaxID=391922 RepID=A0A7W6S132_9PROT|nr:succinate dehydrogenase, cytochrome b556 subunit [Roseospira goensis]MBB4286909.1 succinate dehydrogenase / fumarate reductase cytochrome b subunit [Roseospira goensis]